MSTRGKRGRGRPPKTPSSTGRTNFLKRPRAYGGSEPNSRSSTPVSTRGKPREAAQKSRSFIQNLYDDGDYDTCLNDLDVDRSSDITDLDANFDVDSSGSSDESESVYSEASYSTISSFGRRKLFPRRPRTPDLYDEREIPPLALPASASDLLLETNKLMQTIGIYEVLRHFRTILRLSPYTFEDFCAALWSDEQSALLAETHISLLKSLLREEDSNNTTFGPQDLKDSINITLIFNDGLTWAELVRSYLDSDTHDEFKSAIKPLEKPDYPFVTVDDKLAVLQCLTDLFLGTNAVREEILNEGNIRYDDHCRSCHR